METKTLKEKSVVQNLPKRIVLSSGKGNWEFISIENILYITKESEITILYLKDNKKILSHLAISSLWKNLKTEKNFFQISQKTIINLGYVSKFNSQEWYLLIENKKIFASRRGAQRLKQWFATNQNMLRS